MIRSAPNTGQQQVGTGPEMMNDSLKLLFVCLLRSVITVSSHYGPNGSWVKMSVELHASLSSSQEREENLSGSRDEPRGWLRGREGRVVKAGHQDQILICQLSWVNRELFPETPPLTLLASSPFTFCSAVLLSACSVETGPDIKSLTQSLHQLFVSCPSLFCFGYFPLLILRIDSSQKHTDQNLVAKLQSQLFVTLWPAGIDFSWLPFLLKNSITRYTNGILSISLAASCW